MHDVTLLTYGYVPVADGTWRGQTKYISFWVCQTQEGRGPVDKSLHR